MFSQVSDYSDCSGFPVVPCVVGRAFWLVRFRALPWAAREGSGSVCAGGSGGECIRWRPLGSARSLVLFNYSTRSLVVSGCLL